MVMTILKSIKLLFLIILVLSLIACSQDNEIMISRQKLLMGTFLEIKIICSHDSNEDEIIKDIQDAYELGKYIESKLSLYDEKSELSSFNRQGPGEYNISPLFLELLLITRNVYEISEGAFDPTLKPIIERWGFYHRDELAIPDAKEIAEIMTNTGFNLLHIIEEESMVIKQASVQLDFGGIGKGFAVDKMSEFLKEKGHGKFIINLGGDIFVFNETDDGFVWRIGIKDPGGSQKPYDIILLSNGGIATSASYYNFQTKDGEIFSHIIDPETGFPVDHRISVTIKAPNASLADAYSTAFAVLGPGRYSKVEKKAGDIHGIIMVKDHDGYEEYYINDFKSLLKLRAKE